MSLRPFTRPGFPVPFLLITYKGQLVIQPATDNSLCKVRVNTVIATPPHNLTVSFVANRPNEAVQILNPPMTGALEDTFSIEYSSGSNGVFGFFPEAGFDRNTSKNERDLRWALNLQNAKEFHDVSDCRLECDRAGDPGFEIKEGLFYTFARSDSATLKVARIRPGDNLTLATIGTVLGTIIGPPNEAAGQTLTVRWKQGGATKSVTLPRTEGADKDPAGTFYSISIENIPPLGTDDSGHDELSQYYALVKKRGGAGLQDVPSNEKFRLDVIHLSSFDGDRIPCMSVLIDP